MNHKPYSYYAYACFRAWFQSLNTAGSAEVAQRNRDACAAALKTLDRNTLLILHEIYTSENVLSVAVRKASKKYELETSEIWSLISRIEKDFAIARGLL